MHFSKSIKHIIWDWNGTLVDDVEPCVNLINGILSKRSLPLINTSTYRKTFDFPVVEYYRRVGFDFEKDSFEMLSNEFINGYIQLRRSLPLHAGAIEALQYFNNLNVPQCMLSATQRKALQQTLQEHSIAHFFKNVLGLDHHYADGKAHLGKKWLDTNHVSGDQVLFIGDTLHDLEVANQMGIRCLLISKGHQSHERLSANHKHVIRDLRELITLFDR